MPVSSSRLMDGVLTLMILMDVKWFQVFKTDGRPKNGDRNAFRSSVQGHSKKLPFCHRDEPNTPLVETVAALDHPDFSDDKLAAIETILAS